MTILLTFTFWLVSAGTSALITVTESSGHSVQIRCPYEAGYEDYKKYLCRGDCPVMSSGDIPVESGSPPEDWRFSLKDDTGSRVFTITIADLRADDGGMYWCGVERSGYDIYTEVLLQVRTGDPKKTTVSLPAPSTTPPSVRTSAPATSTLGSTAPARNDGALTGAPSSSAPVHTVVVPVVVMLLLTGLVLFTVLYKLHKNRGQEEPPKISKEADEVDGDDPPVEATYQNLQRRTDDLDSVYQNLRP